jgi:hypothetical protein
MSLPENDDDGAQQTLPVIWNEIAAREMTQMEMRVEKRKDEPFPIFVGDYGTVEITPQTKVKELIFLIHNTFEELPEDITIANLDGNGTCDHLSKDQRIEIKLPAREPVEFTPVAIVKSDTRPTFVATPDQQRKKKDSVPPALLSPPPPPPPAPTKSVPLFPKPPLTLRKIPGCTVQFKSDKQTIWENCMADQKILPLKLEVRDWKFALDASRTEKTLINRGEFLVKTVDPEEEMLLGIARERNITITLKGLTMHGLLDVSLAVMWICSGKFPNDDVKHLLADCLDQLRQVLYLHEDFFL